MAAVGRGLVRMCCSAMVSPFDRQARSIFLEASRKYFQVYLEAPRLPELSADRFLDDKSPISLVNYVSGTWQVSLVELSVMIGVLQRRQCSRLFEIGTFDGRTTRNLHLNAPDATIHTLDLPSGVPSSPDGKVPGNLIQDLVYSGAVKQLWGDSTTFDFSPWYGNTDFVFVDAGHSYRNALADSRTALRLVEGCTGVVFWHDYGPWPGVTQAVDEIRNEVVSEVTVGWIEGTSLAILAAREGHPIRLRESPDSIGDRRLEQAARDRHSTVQT